MLWLKKIDVLVNLKKEKDCSAWEDIYIIIRVDKRYNVCLYELLNICMHILWLKKFHFFGICVNLSVNHMMLDK